MTTSPRFPFIVLVPVIAAGVALAAAPELADLPPVPHGRMRALLERTIFQVDVLNLEIRVDETTASKLGELVRGQKYSEGLADQVAQEVLAAPDAWVRMEFLRSVKQSQFLDGIEDNMERALDVGWISREHFEEVVANLPRWYDFLAKRGIKDGDTMQYRLHQDTTHYLYTGVDGDVLLDMSETDTRSRYSILGSYFAPKSGFRKDLVRSLIASP
jgi:hypothetical protein